MLGTAPVFLQTFAKSCTWYFLLDTFINLYCGMTGIKLGDGMLVLNPVYQSNMFRLNDKYCGINKIHNGSILWLSGWP